MGAFSGFASAVSGNNKQAGGKDKDSSRSGSIASEIVKKAQNALSKSGSGSMANKMDKAPVDTYHKGGMVRKSGLANLQKGERVLTKAQQRKLGLKRGPGKKMRSKGLF